MELNLIYGNEATLEDLVELHDKKGFEFVIEDGVITNVLYWWPYSRFFKALWRARSRTQSIYRKFAEVWVLQKTYRRWLLLCNKWWAYMWRVPWTLSQKEGGTSCLLILKYMIQKKIGFRQDKVL